MHILWSPKSLNDSVCCRTKDNPSYLNCWGRWWVWSIRTQWRKTYNKSSNFNKSKRDKKTLPLVFWNLYLVRIVFVVSRADLVSLEAAGGGLHKESFQCQGWVCCWTRAGLVYLSASLSTAKSCLFSEEPSPTPRVLEDIFPTPKTLAVSKWPWLEFQHIHSLLASQKGVQDEHLIHTGPVRTNRVATDRKGD